MVRKITLGLRANGEEREAMGEAAPRAPKGKREGGAQGGGKPAAKQGFGTLGDLMAKFKK